MWHELVALFQRVPEVALFLSLAIGYALGGVKFGNVSLGATVSTLLAALAIGQVGITVDPLMKSMLFALFIFTVGYRGGPQFFASFKGSAGPQLAFAFVLTVTAVTLTVVLAKVFHLDKGAAGGLMAGALTQSPALGTTTDAVGRLGLPPDAAKRLADSAAVAYAVSYLFGEFGLLLFVRNIAPVLLGVNLKAAAADLERASRQDGDEALGEGQLLAYHPITIRAYRMTTPATDGTTVAHLQRSLGERIFIERIHRANDKPGAPMTVKPDTVIHLNDIIGLFGPRATLSEKAPQLIGEEVDAPSVAGVVLQMLDVVVTNRAFDDKSLREIAKTFGDRTRGLTVLSIHRMEHTLPVTPGTRLQVGDVVRLIGDERHVTSAAATLGYADWPSDKSDLVFLGLGIALGTLLGLMSINIGGVPLTLGAGGGVLVAGLVLGWLRAKRPTFGKLPAAAQWILKDFGLNGFIATIGLSIGPSAVQAVVQNGATLLVAGAILTLVPLIITMYFGKLVLKMNPVILCGALAGAQTNAAVLNAVNDTADSNIAVLGFTLPFAVNNMLLTIAAPIIVALV